MHLLIRGYAPIIHDLFSHERQYKVHKKTVHQVKPQVCQYMLYSTTGASSRNLLIIVHISFHEFFCRYEFRETNYL